MTTREAQAVSVGLNKAGLSLWSMDRSMAHCASILGQWPRKSVGLSPFKVKDTSWCYNFPAFTSPMVKIEGSHTAVSSSSSSSLAAKRKKPDDLELNGNKKKPRTRVRYARTALVCRAHDNDVDIPWPFLRHFIATLAVNATGESRR